MAPCAFIWLSMANYSCQWVTMTLLLDPIDWIRILLVPDGSLLLAVAGGHISMEARVVTSSLVSDQLVVLPL